MDQNYFLRRRDEELHWAAVASCEAARRAHVGLAGCFEEAALKAGSQQASDRAVAEQT